MFIVKISAAAVRRNAEMWRAPPPMLNKWPSAGQLTPDASGNDSTTRSIGCYCASVIVFRSRCSGQPPLEYYYEEFVSSLEHHHSWTQAWYYDSSTSTFDHFKPSGSANDYFSSQKCVDPHHGGWRHPVIASYSRNQALGSPMKMIGSRCCSWRWVACEWLISELVSAVFWCRMGLALWGTAIRYGILSRRSSQAQIWSCRFLSVWRGSLGFGLLVRARVATPFLPAVWSSECLTGGCPANGVGLWCLAAFLGSAFVGEPGSWSSRYARAWTHLFLFLLCSRASERSHGRIHLCCAAFSVIFWRAVVYFLMFSAVLATVMKAVA